MKLECSFNKWYPTFGKVSIDAVVIPIPNEVLEYLEHGSFHLPVEASDASSSLCGSKWSDGTCVLPDEDEDEDEDDDDKEEGAPSLNTSKQPTFPEFSKQIDEVLKDFGAVFVKLNWSSPLDGTWVTPTKTLRCTTLQEIYLLLKSSDRISSDLNDLQSLRNSKVDIEPCLVLKKWREINPCTEFRCFVIESELVGICQRDLSQYYRNIESEKYDIRQDIKSLFNERIRRGFSSMKNYTFDVIRYRKDRVRIIDFGPYTPTAKKTLLFTKEELTGPIEDPPEFRFIGENIAIQPNDTRHFCMPREINEFYQTNGTMSPMDIIRQEVENQEEETQMSNRTSPSETNDRC